MEMIQDYWLSISSLKDTGFNLHLSDDLPIKDFLLNVNYLGVFANNSINDVTGPISCYNLPEFQCLMFPFEIQDLSVQDHRIIKNNHKVIAFVMLLFKNTQEYQQEFAEIRLVLLNKITEWRKGFKTIDDISNAEFKKLYSVINEVRSVKKSKDLDFSSEEYNKQFFIGQLVTFSSLLEKEYSLLFISNNKKYYEKLSSLFLTFGFYIFPAVEKKNNLIIAKTNNNLVVKIYNDDSFKKIKNKSVMFFLDTNNEFETSLRNIDKLEIEEKENCFVYLFSEMLERNLVKKHFNSIFKIRTSNVSFVEEVDENSWIEQLIQFMYRVVFRFKNYQ